MRMKKQSYLLAATLAACLITPTVLRTTLAESAAPPAKATAVLGPTGGNKCRGEVRFVQEGATVKVIGRFEGLAPNEKHAIHIHQYGDCMAPDGSSAGGHYNPEGHAHALPEAEVRHAGDLGNLQADAEGKAKLDIVVKNISISGAKNPIIGRAVIVHRRADDGSQPTGNAGDRIRMRFVEILNPDGTVYTRNLRRAEATDTYTKKGSGEATPIAPLHL